MASPLLLIAFLAGCGSDPVQEDVLAYHDAMVPLLQRNLVLAQGFLDTASKVKKGDADAAAVAQRIAVDVSPVADELSKAAAAITPRTPKLGDAHAVLVQAWSDRAASYHAMSDAWAANDPVAFEAARKKNLQSKLDEERFFQSVNTITSPYGAPLDQYP